MYVGRVVEGERINNEACYGSSVTKVKGAGFCINYCFAVAFFQWHISSRGIWRERN